ncbi:NYN domain-containing protein [Nakamurella sp. A5-74]|uniref:NYN domain-containing protein n=1 Tax=Nakamurella sp. A5-74 TaxID=3158264 RepID=A0AAU8DQE8_9ACTN
MNRCAVLIDAGYLLGAAASVLSGDANRTRLAVNYAELMRAIAGEAAEQTGVPVLRLLWFDGARDGRPTQDHRALGLLPDVKVRLGLTVTHGGRVQQKGVDSYLRRDLTTLARNGAISDAVLIGGDEDLRQGVDEAQDHGVKVHLCGVEAAATEYNQSHTLIAEADRRWIISAAWIGRFVTLRPVGQPTAPAVPSQEPLEPVGPGAGARGPTASGRGRAARPVRGARQPREAARAEPAHARRVGARRSTDADTSPLVPGGSAGAAPTGPADCAAGRDGCRDRSRPGTVAGVHPGRRSESSRDSGSAADA